MPAARREPSLAIDERPSPDTEPLPRAIIVAVRQIPITPRDPRRLAAVVGRSRVDRLITSAATELVPLLLGCRVIHVSSTARGGGVAEMLPGLVGYGRGLGIDARWLVIEGGGAFFGVTKRLHKGLYGWSEDARPFTSDERRVYEATLRRMHERIAAVARPGDVMILHDPQTAGLAALARARGCVVIWRCHVGLDAQNEGSLEAWAFLRPYLESHADHYVFTRSSFTPDWVPADRCSVIQPALDPLSAKNHPMDGDAAAAILGLVGIAAHGVGSATFSRSDGSIGVVDIRCDVLRSGPPPDISTPMAVQVSRWDVMKDMAGVMRAFADCIDGGRDADLVLAGPETQGSQTTRRTSRCSGTVGMPGAGFRAGFVGRFSSSSFRRTTSNRMPPSSMPSSGMRAS